MKTSEPRSRYIVGIDLGTTNSALAYVDALDDQPLPRIMPVPQWETPGTMVEAETLPSFLWLPEKAEWRRAQLKLPLHSGDTIPDYAVGRLPRAQMAVTPGRVVHSAKSWLCHEGVDREEPILPWHSDEVVGTDRKSPIDVSAAYLMHLRDAWNQRFAAFEASYKLELQDVIITVPASFDEVAQQLTLEAARRAGLDRARLRLVEEPQAAFYHWLSRHLGSDDGLGAKLPGLSERSQTVLICDVGGGTTDFSMFEVARGDDPSLPHVKRIAVSDHLLLGGDNIDLSLAYVLEQRMMGATRKLSSRQWAQLTVEARRLKERSLGAVEQAVEGVDDEELFVSVAGEGSGLFASAHTAGIRRSEIMDYVLAGFLPDAAKGDKPQGRRTALKELSLPYASDSAITRHLAAFVAGRKVDAVLYTGGSLKPTFMRDRLTKVIASWQDAAPLVLENDQMDLAVALGAAWSGAVQRSKRGRIEAGYPRSLYLEVAHQKGEHALVCIVPKGLEPARTLRIDQLGLRVVAERPVRFQLFSASRREQDQPGDVVGMSDGTFHPLPALHTKLELSQDEKRGAGQGVLDVVLEVTLSETGVLDLFLVHDGAFKKRWHLNFNVRQRAFGEAEPLSDAQTEAAQSIAEDKLKAASACIEALYGKKKAFGEPGSPKHLVRELEEIFGMERDRWDTALLRALWPALDEGLTRRGRSVQHESTWLYLAGYALRPGYGYELDEWRIADLWRAYQMGPAFPKERQIEEQWWIMWRRVAGGMTREQQEKIHDKLFPQIRKAEVASAEIYMLLGSLERIDMTRKLKLGNQLVQQIVQGPKGFMDQKIWALARIASRAPLYGGPQAIVRPKFVGDWYEQMKRLDPRAKLYAKLVLFYSQAGRIVGDREFDLPDDLRQQFLEKLRAGHASPEQIKVVEEFVPVDVEARSKLFGEALPSGLMLA